MKILINTETLLALGFYWSRDIWVLKAQTRIGWKPDGTLIVGYHEWPKKVLDLADLVAILHTL